jgi:hypothetical protein
MYCPPRRVAQVSQNQLHLWKVVGQRHEVRRQAIWLPGVRLHHGLELGSELENRPTIFNNGIAVLLRMDLDTDALGQLQQNPVQYMIDRG